MAQTLFSQICHRDISMAIACFKSLEKSWQEPWTLNFFEDGSVTPADWDQLRAAFPTAVFHRRADTKDRTETALAKHPECLALYRGSFVAPKILEAPFLSDGIFHYCDPDLLFFRKLGRLWPTAPGPVFLGEEYGFTGQSHSVFDIAIRYRLPLARNLNAGMLRFPMRNYDLDKIEWFLSRSHHTKRPILIEQTCWAFLVADLPHLLIAPNEILCTQKQLPPELPPAIHFIGAQKANFWKYVPETEKISEREPISEFRTLPGRRISRARIAAQVGIGVCRRVAIALRLRPPDP